MQLPPSGSLYCETLPRPTQDFLGATPGSQAPLLPPLLSQVSDLHCGPKTVPDYACPFSPFPFTGLQGTSGMSQAILVSASWTTQTDTPAQPHSTNVTRARSPSQSVIELDSNQGCSLSKAAVLFQVLFTRQTLWKKH